MRLPFGGRVSSDAPAETVPEEAPEIPWPSRRAQAYGGPPPRRPIPVLLSEPEYSDRRFDVPRGLVVGAICLIVTVVVVAGALALRPSSGHAVDSHETTSTSTALSTTVTPTTVAPVRPVVTTTTTVVATTAPPTTSPTTVKKKKTTKTTSPTTVPNPDDAATTGEPATPASTTTAPATVPLPEATPITTGSTTTSSPPVTTTAGSTTAADITPGAFCSVTGAHGTYNGVSYVCSLDNAAGQPYLDQRARWRQG